MKQRIAWTVARLGGVLKFFPSDPEERAAIMKFLAELVDTPAQLDWIYETLSREWTEWLGTAALRAAFIAHFYPADEFRPIGDPGCRRCGGTGFEIVEKNGVSGAKPCSCRMPKGGVA